MNDIKELLSHEDFEKFYDFTLKKALECEGDISWCPTADCKYAFVYNPEKDGKEFKCAKCEKHYCLQCRSDWHDKISCEEYQKGKDPDKAE